MLFASYKYKAVRPGWHVSRGRLPTVFQSRDSCEGYGNCLIDMNTKDITSKVAIEELNDRATNIIMQQNPKFEDVHAVVTFFVQTSESEAYA